ncbi:MULTISPECIES: hypothetical protein [Streptomyces]|jgi:hypothetical protein|uniref:hypothetical protein n=1 Tax=Streptomyces TaxID=1883 RepID=UPI000D5290D5|nr:MULTISPECIES: hypothetical protein [Streptomyces]AWE50491.1 hypothetical protein DC008_12685 [Streptomyces nigra]MCF2537047.1 hypothetical protein [Streptomyces sp. FB2]
MRKLQRAALAAAVIGSLTCIATGTASAQPAYGGDGCHSHDFNLDILGEVGLLNGLGGNLINGEGSPGAQHTHLGSSCGGGH